MFLISNCSFINFFGSNIIHDCHCNDYTLSKALVKSSPICSTVFGLSLPVTIMHLLLLVKSIIKFLNSDLWVYVHQLVYHLHQKQIIISSSPFISLGYHLCIISVGNLVLIVCCQFLYSILVKVVVGCAFTPTSTSDYCLLLYLGVIVAFVAFVVNKELYQLYNHRDPFLTFL